MAMLADGSNPEGVDPSPALTWASKEDFKDVVFYGMHCSPPCTKIRAFLLYNDIPFKHVACQKKKGSDYKMMPVMDVAGKQVNDSYIILKYMLPVLGGEFNQEWEDKITLQLGLSLEYNMEMADLMRWAGQPYGFGIPNCLLKCCLKGKIWKTIHGNCDRQIKNNPNKKIVDINDLGKELKAAIGDNKFVGGEKPSAVDISFYATCAPFYFSKCEYTTNMIKDCGLQPWWDAMDQVIPLTGSPKSLYP